MAESIVTILIADRNPHVRNYLKREIGAAGYRVQLAKSAREILGRVSGPEPVDILILDLNLPDEGGSFLLEKIKDRAPSISVIVHGFLSDFLSDPISSAPLFFVEKRGTSIDDLKRTIAKALRERRSPGVIRT